MLFHLFTANILWHASDNCMAYERADRCVTVNDMHICMNFETNKVPKNQMRQLQSLLWMSILSMLETVKWPAAQEEGSLQNTHQNAIRLLSTQVVCCYYQHANVRIIGLYFCYFITFYVILAVKLWIVFICRWVRCCVTNAMFELAQPPVTYAAWNSFKNARPYITHGVPIMYFRKSCPVRYLLIVNQIYNTHTRIPYYSTGVQIVSCTLSDDSVLSESTGLFNPVFLCQPMKSLLTKKSANEIVSFKSG